MAQESLQLAEYAAGLSLRDIPGPVIQRAKDAIADTIAAIAFGAHLPWSRIIVGYAQKRGAGGKAYVFAPGGAKLQAPAAAFANGSLAHAFEMDNLTWPNTGVHPGATMAMPALAVAQERGLGGRALLEAVVAGSELMIRVGRATKHNNETRGFHAPGTTGPFGSAAAVGRLLRFDAPMMLNALGIAGSTSAGLLEFAKSGTGAMVKRLHLGRAAESGIMAAHLAEQGFTGPVSVLEGQFGFLNVYCGEHDLPALTRGLGSEWASLRIMLKRFPVHITSHTSVQAIEDLRREHGYAGSDVASIAVAGTPKMASVHNIPEPADLMLAQYSLPFNVALAHYKDARDPASFNMKNFNDPAIRALAKLVTVTVADEAAHGHTIASTVTVTLKDGRVLTRRVDSFKGTPEQPLSVEEMREKFLLLTRHCDGKAMARLFERLQNLENEKSLDFVKVDAAKARKAVTVKRAASAQKKPVKRAKAR
ncbi:MmgE/PrpD family protein [Rhodoplanes sp. Z2-YC6860]|uniref:MmgE/PrpD family protein n=1 Tax=Rhodoplanes sp. Z2-YC6860 TaxID=674703 RepID=UPI00078E648D|nr:MmgE/PrpD family protein [Rhodoplanes sp. Z2-YC6860]AMN41001.1 propionate catabolism protein [Rhodoplanes sp. Z2-YC6860]